MQKPSSTMGVDEENCQEVVANETVPESVPSVRPIVVCNIISIWCEFFSWFSYYK